jgi:hypothetical protein
MATLFRLDHVRRATRAGQFGVLSQDELPFAVTLERAYQCDGEHVTKIPPGTYRCTRTTFYRGGYETYEVHVPGHSRVLFHLGNWSADSDGCILVGESYAVLKGMDAIADSRAGFAELMEKAAGRSEFELEVA